MKSLKEEFEFPYPLEIVEDAEEGGYVAFYPDLPGCITCADTLEKVKENALDAKKEWLIARLEEQEET